MIARAQIMIVICLVGMLTGCGGGMIPGSIYTADGRVLPLQIEKAHRTGAIKAHDPSTGETFAGTYVGIKESYGVSTSGTTISGGALSSNFGSGRISANTADTTAYLKGDKGTMLTCAMKIEAGFSPHGIGNCEDNHGRTYKLQF